MQPALKANGATKGNKDGAAAADACSHVTIDAFGTPAPSFAKPDPNAFA